MPFRRYEVLLPKRYNDGSPVPGLKFNRHGQRLASASEG